MRYLQGSETFVEPQCAVIQDPFLKKSCCENKQTSSLCISQVCDHTESEWMFCNSDWEVVEKKVMTYRETLLHNDDSE